MRTIDGIAVFGEIESGQAFAQIKRCAECAAGAALMGDHHAGYSMPIGGVAAYRGVVSPSGVGYDIACGNKAVRLACDTREVRHDIARIMDAIWERIPFGVGSFGDEAAEHEVFNHPAWAMPEVAPLKEMARQQLGSVGSGNHFVDILVDENEEVWCGVHFGSRGLGYKIADTFMRRHGCKDGMDEPPLFLDAESESGREYIAAMQLAGAYAYAGRDLVCKRVAALLGADILEEVHNHHNYAWLEEHGGEELWVVRKGATPAFPGQRGFIGGSMGDDSVIVEGVHHEIESAASFCSTVHGAGRVMGRMQAKGKYNRKSGECVRAGLVSRAMMDEWIAGKCVELRGAGVDESPHCYKRLDEVLRNHANTVKVLHVLKPIGVAMAGEDTRR